MWVFSKTGFVSAVENFEAPDEVLVRARIKGDLDSLIEHVKADWPGQPLEASETPGNDYRFRVSVPKVDFASWLMKLAATIDYNNFKAKSEQASIERGDSSFVRSGRGYALTQCWQVMHELQENAATSDELNSALDAGAKLFDELNSALDAGAKLFDE